MPGITIGDVAIRPGETRNMEVPVAKLPTGTDLGIPVRVLCGKKPGPNLWITAAVHGDEVNGVEIIRRVLERVDASRLLGNLIAVPIVNVYGLIEQTRYLPDRRDLNRSFPGSSKGSLAARLAHIIMEQIVGTEGYGVDLHTGANHRTNLPQIRANLECEETHRIASVFSAPVMIHSKAPEGTLRRAAVKRGIKVLLYEAGEALRFDETDIKTGVSGVLRVMAAIGMRKTRPKITRPTVRLDHSSWLRARRSGIMRLHAKLGDKVAKNQTLGYIADAFAEDSTAVKATHDGTIIGHTSNPLVHQGDGIVHIGYS